MSSLVGFSQSQFGHIAPQNTYRCNAKAILNTIEKQFIQAIKDVNQIALSQGNIGIVFFPVAKSAKMGIPLGEEFNYPITYQLWFAEGPEMDYENPWRYPVPELLHFFCETSLCFHDKDKLIQMARNGNIETFDDIYEHWRKELSDEINFFRQNNSQIQAMKQKIQKQFALAFGKSKDYALGCGLELSCGNIDKQFEPIGTYRIAIVSNYNGVVRTDPIGEVCPTINNKIFKQIVVDEDSRDLEDIYTHCLNEMKEMIDQSGKQSSLWSSLLGKCSVL